MVNIDRASKVERFLKICGNDPVYSCECTARVYHEAKEDVLVLSYEGMGPDDMYVGLCCISDSMWKYIHVTYMNGQIHTTNEAFEHPMEHPWEQSVAHFDDYSAEVIREFIGSM